MSAPSRYRTATRCSAENDGRTWLLWDGKRSPIDLADRAVTDGLGIGGEALTPQPIATGLFNAIAGSARR